VLKLFDLDEVSMSQSNTNRDEALSALEVLGFLRKASERVVEKIVKEEPDASVESIIKLKIYKGRYSTRLYVKYIFLLVFVWLCCASPSKTSYSGYC
jgi:hypothetical protein